VDRDWKLLQQTMDKGDAPVAPRPTQTLRGN
jgi:hypothetical protein